MENSLGCDATADEVADRNQVSEQATPAIDKRFRDERTNAVADEILCSQFGEVGPWDGAFVGEIHGVGDLLVTELDAATAP